MTELTEFPEGLDVGTERKRRDKFVSLLSQVLSFWEMGRYRKEQIGYSLKVYCRYSGQFLPLLP